MERIDLTSRSTEEWVEFIFSHEVAPSLWYFEPGVIYYTSPDVALTNLAYLFLNPNDLLQGYTREQIEQGLWIVSSAGGMLEEALTDERASPLLKEKVIVATTVLFRTYLCACSYPKVTQMWWDAIAQRFSYSENDVETPSTLEKCDEQLRNTIFDVLCTILGIDALDCEIGALHGLGHLQHPKTREVIEQYLAAHPLIDKEVREYAEACIIGDIS